METRLIRASHAKPWEEASDEERLDSANGFPLAVKLDAIKAGLKAVDAATNSVANSTHASKCLCQERAHEERIGEAQGRKAQEQAVETQVALGPLQ